MGTARFIVAWLAAFTLRLLGWSFRLRIHDDPRPALREEGRPYAYAILHCHQVSAVIACEPGTGAMVSRSVDGDLLVPSLRVHGIVPFRGSTRQVGKDKGGAVALDGLIKHVEAGAPAYFAVDGPRGPRNQVGRGIAKLCVATGAAVVMAVPVPRHRWILRGTWDRMQFPKPFTTMEIYFAPALQRRDDEGVDDFRQRVEAGLVALEEEHDPEEAAKGKVAAAARRARFAREAAGKGSAD